MAHAHSFHIPVMGIGFTIDTPLNVSPYGIDSVISLVDDILIERLRKMYSKRYTLPYTEISNKVDDFRAKRITSYLNLINSLTEKTFDELLHSAKEKGSEFKKFVNLLPDCSPLKAEVQKFSEKYLNTSHWEQWLKEHLSKGSIDVNIMTKVDKPNFKGNEKLAIEFNDAHAALRGFANSDLKSSMVLSAGMNPKLYSYIEQFNDFYPDSSGRITKKIILKVSDYRSALTQGKFLAKKGLWVSEYRIESGLNCGGHAFATAGFLMGPILNEFKEKRTELINDTFSILIKALEQKERPLPKTTPTLKISAQGGVGTSEEHQFLIEEYQINSVGWGTPFLLVPEVVNIDPHSLNLLCKAKEDDLYLSNISPLGVPFNSLRGNTKDLEKQEKIGNGKPGSSCPKRYLALNNEFDEKGVCTASRQYLHLKQKELETKNLGSKTFETEMKHLNEKSCICVGLGTSALLVNKLDTKREGNGVSVCPGPNMAYFDTSVSLETMVHHIYGKTNIINRTDRPHMFIKELTIYLDHLKQKIDEAKVSMVSNPQKTLLTFINNLNEGVQYYQNLFGKMKEKYSETANVILNSLEENLVILKRLRLEIESL